MKSILKISQELLARWLDRIPVPSSFKPITENPANTIVVTQSKSWVIQALLLSFAKRSGLSGIKNASAVHPQSAQSSELLWVAFSDQSSIENLAQQKPELGYSTFSVFETRGPVKSNPNFKMTFAQSIMTLLRSPYTHYHFGEPTFPAEQVRSARWSILRLLKLDFYRNFKLVRGIPFQPIHTQEEIVLDSKEATVELGAIAEREGWSAAKARRKASKAFYTMAANPSAPLFGFAARLVGIFLRNVFAGFKISGLDSLSKAVKSRTVVLVPMHRSHFDYLIMGSLLYQAKLNPPLVAAGINLSFWPFGFFIRSLGGYFVKREAKGDKINSLVLRRYVTYLVKRGHLQEFFIEGGRSRSGRMRPPKTGLLSIIVDCVLDGIRKDVLFIPVSITYENVVEDKSLADENTGRSKTKESLISLLGVRKIFRRNYGEVIVHLGEPLSLAEDYAEFSSQNREATRRDFVASFAKRLTVAIRTQTNPSLTALAATAITLAPRYVLKRDELIRKITDLAEIACMLRQANRSMGEPTPSLSRFTDGHTALIDDLPSGGLIESIRSTDLLFTIPGTRRFTADFYRNSSFHLFYPAAILSVLELLDLEPNSENALKAYPVFNREFLFAEPEVYRQEIDSLIEQLKTVQAIKAGPSRLIFDRQSRFFIPSLLLAPIQSILWAHKFTNESAMEANEKSVAAMQRQFKSTISLGAILRTEAATYYALASGLETARNLAKQTDQSWNLSTLKRANQLIQAYLLEQSFLTLNP